MHKGKTFLFSHSFFTHSVSVVVKMEVRRNNLHNLKSKKQVRNFLLFLMIIVLGSCSLERDLSKAFLEKHDSISVLLIQPDFVYKTNKKTWEIKGFDQLSSLQQDSALFVNSTFLKEIDDSVFMDKYFTALVAELKNYGITIYNQEQLTDFMASEGTAYQVSVVQIELEEDIYPYHVEDSFDDTAVYFEDFNLNTVNINNWFEISKLNDTKAVNNLLYASHYLMDEIEGQFVKNIFTGEIKYKYNLFPIDTNGIYVMAELLGTKYAGYIFDYLLNEFVFRNFPENQRPEVYLHYNRNSRTLTPAGDDRFIFMKE